ncbi:hypothetical protein BHE74_00048761 [Ensete ventricosum]|nr:hypothetical protein BHE74_00048761 [Ensete ventricosum]
MMQRVNHFIGAETLIVEKHEEKKHPRMEQPRGPTSGPSRRRIERPYFSRSRPLITAMTLRSALEPHQDPRPATSGDSTSAHKAYARATIEKRPRHHLDPEISFQPEGEEYLDHDDALVIIVRIANARVKQIMIDIGSAADILYFEAFQKLGLTDQDLTPLTSMLTGFTRDSIAPFRTMTLLLTIGEEPHTKTLMVIFMVVDLPSAYNAIIGQPTLNRLRAVVSTFHRSVKFPTNAGVDEARSDPRESRRCYLAFTDSQLVARQVRGEFKARDDTMAKYLAEAR